MKTIQMKSNTKEPKKFVTVLEIKDDNNEKEIITFVHNGSKESISTSLKNATKHLQGLDPYFENELKEAIKNGSFRTSFVVPPKSVEGKCPDCGHRNIYYNVNPEESGYIETCQKCGHKIFLCDACLNAKDNPSQKCDWNEKNGGTCFRGCTYNRKSFLKDTNNLRKLILENPNLPILVFASEEANTGDYPFEYCSDVRAEIGECLDLEKNEINNAHLYTDRVEFKESVEDKFRNFEPAEMSWDEFIDQKVSLYDPYWRQCIIITVDN